MSPLFCCGSCSIVIRMGKIYLIKMVICNIDVNRMLISYYVLLGEGNKNMDVG